MIEKNESNNPPHRHENIIHGNTEETQSNIDIISAATSVFTLPLSAII